MAFTSDAGARAAGRWFVSRLAGLMLAMAATAVHGAASLSCGPTQLGAPCGDAGPATQSVMDGPGPGAGNPVNVATGNKYQRETDLPALPGVLGLELVRHYNSFDTRQGPWGTGWTLSYDTRLYRVGDSIQIVQADGSRLAFAASPGSELCLPEDPAYGTLRILDAAIDAGGDDVEDHGGYVWHWRGGRTLRFDRAGGLVRIEAANGQAVSIRRGRVPGHPSHRQILQVTDPAGRALVLQYAPGTGVVSAATTPAGRLRYRHVEDRLQAVVYPDGHWRGYLYEAAHQSTGASRLTGIVAGRPGGRTQGSPPAGHDLSFQRAGDAPVRLNTWIYDVRGRVVASIPGAPDSTRGRIDIRYGEESASGAGRQSSRTASHRTATVRDELGRETRFQLGVRAGRHVVLRVDGQGCAGCPPVGGGRDDDVLDTAAGPGAVHDKLGRVIRIGSRSDVHVQWWRDTRLPSRISMPSVVPGRRHVIRLHWQPQPAVASSHALPVRVEETGWRPGNPPQSLSRRIDLGWQASGTAGLVLQGVQADGPVTSTPMPQAGAPGGWPGFEEARDDFGNLVHWRSSATGMERRSYDVANRLQERAFANGTTWRYDYDGAGRLARLRASTQGQAEAALGSPPEWSFASRDEIRIRWEGELPAQVENRYEQQTNRYDRRGSMIARRIVRPIGSPSAAHDGDTAFDYSERFERDETGRITRHVLPEGGALFYGWGPGRKLHSIHWVDAGGRIHVLLDSLPGQPGYVQSNGTRMQQALQGGRLAGLAYWRQDEPVWAQALAYDAGGRIVGESTRRHGEPARHERYGYDARSRLVATGSDWYAWAEDGSLDRHHRAGQTGRPAIHRDASGLPTRVAGRTLQYGANRRLVQVREGGRVLASYRHNAFGERIARVGSDGMTHFLFHEHQVVAEWRGDGRQGGVVQRYVFAHGVPVALIRYATPQRFRAQTGLLQNLHAAVQSAAYPGLAALGVPGLHDAMMGLSPDADIHAIHGDALGLPRVVTDAHGRIRWAAEYSAFGMARVASGSLDMPLRLPGQWFDADTGWHDNYLRTYDPQAGHYLEPDPLGVLPAREGGMHGLVPITSAFGYAAQQPRRHADPLGLVLFAFDGTRESPGTATNVYQMALLYRNAQDVQAGLSDIHYQPGPGDPRRPDLDAAVASSADAIVAAQWSRLLQHLAAFQSSDRAATIDLVGYSRGAALARHFANQVAQNTRRGRFWQQDAQHGTVTACIDLRFMGLFDSVAQFGLLGSRNHEYDFSIAPDWELVAHAVALHEHRALFPLLSTADAAGQLPANVIEQPFVGAHGDIGGGLVQVRADGEDTHDLSDVALAWMLGMAKRAGLAFDRPRPAQQEVTDPVLHDMRASSQRVSQRLHDAYGESPAWPRSDREVRSAMDTRLERYQGDHEDYGSQTRAQTEAFIRRIAGWTGSSEPVVGIVDMEAYAAWLASP